MTIQLPDQGFIFWPVGNGDTTTIRVDTEVYLQVDLHHMKQSEENGNPSWPVVDELIKILPKRDGKPYLSCFALTHPDQDHCQGFKDLNDRVTISEIWMSPRVFHEFRKDLCDDAQAFRDEAMQRVKKAIHAGGDPGQGNRIRIIGYDSLLTKSPFKGFPQKFLTVPGSTITTLDGDNACSRVFKAFVHAPFKDDSSSDRNDCSLAFQISLFNGNSSGQALLMGDLSYPIIRRIFNRSKHDTLKWNILLAPHHCSKSVMYWKDEGEEEETLKQDIMHDFGKTALSTSYVISSSEPIPTSNSSGDNPPHVKAKRQYNKYISPNKFICTQEHPDDQDPKPIIFGVNKDGISYLGSESKSSQSMTDVLKITGGAVKSSTAVGFGHGTH